jgi:RND superfamily putative drug exporter
LVGGESAINYDVSNAVNKITLNYVIPIMTIISIAIFTFLFRRPEMVVPASATSLVSMIATLGLSIFIISNVLKITTLWLVVPLAITVVLSVGSDYSVFYFFGLKAALEECKILEEGECAHKMNAVYYNAAKMFDLILGFATTFAVAYFSLLVSNIWALKELGISLGLAPILLVTALFTLVPAMLALVWK